MRINELPDYHISDDSLSDRYVEELQAVETPEALYEFVRRWSALWEHGRRHIPEITHPSLDRIVGCKFDAAQALDCIKKCRKSGCEHVGSGESCPGMHIILPTTLLISQMAAERFGAPICAALHQACCDDENHNSCF